MAILGRLHGRNTSAGAVDGMFDYRARATTRAQCPFHSNDVAIAKQSSMKMIQTFAKSIWDYKSAGTEIE